jgi:hypothetical protein
MMKARVLWLGLLLLAGCQEQKQVLHWMLDPTPQVFNFTHKLKELQGETRVDILMVIDNSGSMGTHQQAVIRNSDLFIQEFTKIQKVLDWRMGLLSTDTKEKPYIGFEVGNFLDKNTPSPVAAFNAAVGRLGTSGDSTEKPWGAIQHALMTYPTWARKGAILALIVLTDAQEQSQISSQDFVQFLTQIKSGTHQVVSYGVYAAQDWNCPNSGEGLTYAGSPYEELAQKLKGKNYPLCSQDFGNNLADLGKDLVKRVKSPRIALTMRPQIETIQVKWKDQILPGGPKDQGGNWQYDFDLNAIVFHDLDFAPDENEEVVISYEEAVKARANP